MRAGGSRQSWQRRIPAVAGVAVLIAFMASPTAVAGTAPVHHGGLIVSTADGKLQGKQAEGIDEYLGIPYAAPPVGDLRWRRPSRPPRGPAPREATLPPEWRPAARRELERPALGRPRTAST